MGHRRPMLEPVLEYYRGPPVSYDDTDRKPRHGTAKVAPAAAAGSKASKASTTKSSLMKNPLSSVFGKLRDRYIKTMNEMAMGGDYAAVAGCHGCVPGQDYPGSLEYQQSDRRKNRELQALREELGEESESEDLTTRTSRYLS